MKTTYYIRIDRQRAGWPDFDSVRFHFATMFQITGIHLSSDLTSASGFAQGSRWPEHEINHSPLSSNEVKNVWNFTVILYKTYKDS
jgi:hypothetical protein